MEINRTLRLSDNQYYKTETNKTQVVLHHTVGGSAISSFRWWQSQPIHVATAYIIERDGTIHEVFDPRYWAHHLGLRHSKNTHYNKSSIGIELASEGGLTRQGDYLYAFDGKKRLYNVHTDTGLFVHFPNKFRGFEYFDAYDNAQVDSANKLVKYLCEQYSIAKVCSESFEFDEKWYEFNGVITHVNVRTDKSDLNPSWSWSLTKQTLGLV